MGGGGIRVGFVVWVGVGYVVTGKGILGKENSMSIG